jgi:hypothetical protein
MNATPICVAFRQVTRQLRTGALSSTRSNVSGIPKGLPTLRQPPRSDRLRTVQSIVARRPIKVMRALLRARRRASFRRSYFGLSIVRSSGHTRPSALPWTASLTCMDRVKTRGLGAQPCAKHAARAACEIAAPEIGGAARRWRSKLR